MWNLLGILYIHKFTCSVAEYVYQHLQGDKMRTTYIYQCEWSVLYFPTQKSYHNLLGTISSNYKGRCFCDDLSGQILLDEFRSWGAWFNPFTFSPRLLQYSPGSGGILWCHYSLVKILNLGVKINPVHNFRLVIGMRTDFNCFNDYKIFSCACSKYKCTV